MTGTDRNVRHHCIITGTVVRRLKAVVTLLRTWQHLSFLYFFPFVFSRVLRNSITQLYKPLSSPSVGWSVRLSIHHKIAIMAFFVFVFVLAYGLFFFHFLYHGTLEKKLGGVDS